MKLISITVLLFVVAFQLGCSWRQKAKAIGPWQNAYAGNEELAGVVISQFPEAGRYPWLIESYKGKHPAMILYYFWNGRINQRAFEPDGTETENFWWNDSLKPGEWIWRVVDYSQGSDPKFIRHRDPRPK